jgi:lysozyme
MMRFGKDYLDEALELVKKHEGFRSEPYTCTAGYLTVAFGKRVDYLNVDKETGEKWCLEDLKKLDSRLRIVFQWYKDSPKMIKAVVLDLVYQLGIKGFSRFKKSIYLLETEQYEEAAEEMLDSKWARSDSPNRAKELSDIVAKVKSA